MQTVSIVMRDCTGEHKWYIPYGFEAILPIVLR